MTTGRSRPSAPRRSAASSVTLLLLVATGAIAQDGPILTDVTEQVGVDFVHFNGMTGRLYYPEVVGSGGALFDYDNDGDLDLYLVQGALLGSDRTMEDAVLPWEGDGPPRDRLLRNDRVDGPDGRSFRFTDVTEEAGIDARGYGIGAAVGDVDGDGHLDLYVLAFGANQLWRNRGDGSFEEIGADLNLDDERFSVAATFTDFDRDGRLDVYVVNYVDFRVVGNRTCTTERGEADYCLPSAYPPQPDALLLNRPEGFVDVSSSAGLGPAAHGLGVLAADFDGNGSADLYVANDLMPNHLLLQQPSADGPVRFSEEGLLFGAALNAEGRAEASMGIDAADFDGDSDLDLHLGHFSRESNTLYVMGDSGFFTDESDARGIATPSWTRTAFGTRFVDLDLDGDLDLVVANGMVTFPPGVDRTENPFPLAEPDQFLRNDGGRFVDATDRTPALATPHVSRAVLGGDLDGDGDFDLVITSNSGPTRVLRNDTESERPWLGIDLRLGEDAGRRPAYGASIRFLDGAPGQPRIVRVHSDGGYAGASDHRVVRHVVEPLSSEEGEGDEPRAVRFEVTWPSGKVEEFSLPPSSSYRELMPGSGITRPGSRTPPLP